MQNVNRREPPRVSVIVPTYNAESFLHQSLNSVMMQTFEDFEVIVVDDASTDNTYGVVKNFTSRDSRFRYIRLTRNSGRPAVPRNQGIAEARGEFVAFLDADDIWTSRKLARQVAALDANPDVALVHSYLWEFRDLSRLQGLVHLSNPQHRRASPAVLMERNVVQCSSAVVRASVLGSVGVFDERIELRAVEDYELWARIAQHHRLLYLSEVHGFYRWSAMSTSRQEDMLEKHIFLNTTEGFTISLQPDSLARRVARRLVGIPPALYFHTIEATIRQIFGWKARTW